MKKIMFALMAAAAIFAVSCNKPANEEEEEGGIQIPATYEFTQASAWGVTGAIASATINWDGDIAMTTDGTWHVAKGVVLTASDEFKFRKDAAWAENFGGALTAAGELFDVTQDGPNIKVPADGTYDLLLNVEAGKAVAIAK
jgi:hypothetical protein